ncbi:hypothetical protein D3C87_1483030 [compost metagenome]
MLADDEHRQDQGHGLRHDGEIGVAHAALEHGRAQNQGQQAGQNRYRHQGEPEAFEGHPEPGKRGQLVPVHEVRDAGRGLNLGGLRRRGFQLQEHGHAITAQAKKHPLAQAQNAAIAPAQHQAERDKGIGQVFANEIEPEDVQA